jgi:hypothetical protein
MKWLKNDWPSEQSLSGRLHAKGMTDDRLFRGSRNQLELMKTVESATMAFFMETLRKAYTCCS